MHDTPALQASGLTKRFGGRTVIDNVSLAIPQGGAFGLAGPEGAGKTTLIRLLLGLTPASSGSSRVLGISVPAQRGLALGKVGVHGRGASLPPLPHRAGKPPGPRRGPGARSRPPDRVVAGAGGLARAGR